MRIILASGLPGQDDSCAIGNDGIILAYVIIAIACSSILICLYLRTFYHAYTGSKYKFILRSVSALIISNIGTLMIVTANYILLVKGKANLGLCWMVGLGYLFQDTTFNLVHVMMAQKYQAISTKIPYFIKRLPLPKRNESWEVFKESLLVTMNVLFPLGECAFSIPFNYVVCVQMSKDVELPVQIGSELSQLGTGFF